MTRVSIVSDVSGYSTDAKFRAWGSAVSGALAACGLVQTADTGQIDWGTVLWGANANTYSGYEIWRFDDDLQSECPIYFKIQYGNGFGTGGQIPGTDWQIGTGSNGSGTLTGLKSDLLAIRGPSTYHTVSSTVSSNVAMGQLFTHTDGYFLAFAESSRTGTASGGSSPFFIAIERTRDQTDGYPTPEGFMAVYARSTTNYNSTFMYCHVFNYDKKVVMAANVEIPMYAPGDSSSYSGLLFPVWMQMPELSKCAGLVGVMSADAATYATFTAKPIGSEVTRTYIKLGWSGMTNQYMSLAAGSWTSASNEQNCHLAFLWED